MSAQEDFDSLSEWAKRFFPDDEKDAEKRDNFLGEAMDRLGHKRSVSWFDSEDKKDDKPKSKSFFDQY